MSGPPDPDAAAVPNFCTKLADGTTVTFTLPSWDALYLSARRLMNPFSLSRAQRVAVPVGLSVAADCVPPLPPPHPVTTRARAATTVAAGANLVLLMASFAFCPRRRGPV